MKRIANSPRSCDKNSPASAARMQLGCIAVDVAWGFAAGVVQWSDTHGSCESQLDESASASIFVAAVWLACCGGGDDSREVEAAHSLSTHTHKARIRTDCYN